MNTESSHQSHSSDQANHVDIGPTRLEMAARLGAGLLVAAIAVGSFARIAEEPSEPFSVVDVSKINEWVTGSTMPSTSK